MFFKSFFKSKERLNKEKELENIDKVLSQLNNSLSQAKQDLGDMSSIDIKNMYENGTITKSQYDEAINSIEALEHLIISLPKTIASTKAMRNNLLNEIKTLK